MSILIISVLLGTLFEATGIPKNPPAPAAVEVRAQYTVDRSYIGEVTAYSSREEETDDTPFITASGTNVRWGIVATNAYPLGTLVRFPELYPDEVFVVEDRMNRRYKNRFDIWFPEHKMAERFGKKHTLVEIITEADPQFALDNQ